MKPVRPEVNELPLQVREVMALEAALADLVADHKRRGLPLAVWYNGKVASLTVEELERLKLTPVKASS